MNRDRLGHSPGMPFQNRYRKTRATIRVADNRPGDEWMQCTLQDTEVVCAEAAVARGAARGLD
jgi:hypothetical protein